MKEETIKKSVRNRYGKIAKPGSSCCGQTSSCGTGSSCCGSTSPAQEISKAIGYTEAELGSVPEGANLGLGCGNPVALASLKEGETVLDLGSGAGIDLLLAAKLVGPKGKVIGVDMTPAMIERAPSARGPHSKRPRNQPQTAPSTSFLCSSISSFANHNHISTFGYRPHCYWVDLAHCPQALSKFLY